MASFCLLLVLYAYAWHDKQYDSGAQGAYTFRGLIFLIAAASAEFFADIVLCPMEMVKVKVSIGEQPHNGGICLFEAACYQCWQSL